MTSVASLGTSKAAPEAPRPSQSFRHLYPWACCQNDNFDCIHKSLPLGFGLGFRVKFGNPKSYKMVGYHHVLET